MATRLGANVKIILVLLGVCRQ